LNEVVKKMLVGNGYIMFINQGQFYQSP
jgi:hypothetical protein